MTLAGQPSGAVAVAPASLTYSATTWNTGQAVTVRAVSDTDSTDETVTVNVTDTTPNRNRFDPELGGSTLRFAPTELFAVVGTQSLTTSSTQSNFFNLYGIHVCPWTSVPQSTGTSVSGCATLANRPGGNSITRNVSVTQAMVTNGRFVLVVKQAIGFGHIIFADWVPLVTPRTPTVDTHGTVTGGSFLPSITLRWDDGRSGIVGTNTSKRGGYQQWLQPNA